MYEPILAGAGLVLLLILCLPFARIQKLVLEIYALALRLALLALLAAGGYLWFFPERLPPAVTETVNNFPPPLRGFLPEPGTPLFGACAAACVVAVLLPLLAVLDVTRQLAGRRLSRLRALSARRVAEAPPPPPVVPPVEVAPPRPPVQHEESPAPHRTDRRRAAETLASAGSRKPFRYPGPSVETPPRPS
jgi:hypothetical protein